MNFSKGLPNSDIRKALAELCTKKRIIAITAIARDGEPIEPIRTNNAFAAQCGVLVRDRFPISIH